MCSCITSNGMLLLKDICKLNSSVFFGHNSKKKMGADENSTINQTRLPGNLLLIEKCIGFCNYSMCLNLYDTTEWISYSPINFICIPK